MKLTNVNLMRLGMAAIIAFFLLNDFGPCKRVRGQERPRRVTSEANEWKPATLPQNLQASLQNDAPHITLPEIPRAIIKAEEWKPASFPEFYDPTYRTTKKLTQLIVLTHQQKGGYGADDADYTIVTRYTEVLPTYTRNYLTVRRVTMDYSSVNLGIWRKYKWKYSNIMRGEVRPDNEEVTVDIYYHLSDVIGAQYPKIRHIVTKTGPEVANK